MDSTAASTWAHHVFSRARLGDARRTRRLTAIAAAVLQRPGGTVTGSIRSGAEQEGTFRFLESSKFESQAVADAVFEAAAIDCAASKHVYVAVDQTDLTFIDRKGVRGLGPHYNRKNKFVRGAQVMNALALDEAGTPVGLLHQQWWLRPEKSVSVPKNDRRDPKDRESWNWVRVMDACTDRLKANAPGTVPW